MEIYACILVNSCILFFIFWDYSAKFMTLLLWIYDVIFVNSGFFLLKIFDCIIVNVCPFYKFMVLFW